MPILGIWASSRPAVAPDTGAMFPLQVITVGPAGASSVSFTNIPNTYTHLQIRCITKRTTAGSTFDSVRIQMNGDSGSSYTLHRIFGQGTSVGADGYASSTFSGSTSIMGGTPSAGYTNIFAAGIIDILDYANTNKNKTMRALSGADGNGAGELFFNSAMWLSTSAITSITFLLNSDNFAQYSQFALYGIKGA